MEDDQNLHEVLAGQDEEGVGDHDAASLGTYSVRTEDIAEMLRDDPFEAASVGDPDEAPSGSLTRSASESDAAGPAYNLRPRGKTVYL